MERDSRTSQEKTFQLKPYQEIGRDFLASRTKALLADEMRLGKSAQSICAADKLRANKILVVCPSTAKTVWEREFRKWSDRPLKITTVYGTSFVIPSEIDVVIINYDLLIYSKILDQLLKRKFAVGIFDEAHYLKGMKSKRTKAILLKYGLASRCHYKWFLTGTPILNRPSELFPLLKATAPEVIHPYKTFANFARHFCGGYWDGFQLVAKGATNKEELHSRLTQSFMLRRTRKDVFTELPEPECELLPIESDAPVESLMSQEFNWTRSEAKYQRLGKEGEELAVIRHKLALHKVKPAISHIEYLLTLVDKLVVFAFHKDVIEGLKTKLLKHNPVVVHGSVASLKRQDAVDQFTHNKDVKVFIGQYQAAGVSIDLSASKTILFVESGWVPGEIDQAMSRCENITKTEKTLVQFLVYKKSVEEHMLRTVIDKKKNISDIVESDASYLFT